MLSYCMKTRLSAFFVFSFDTKNSNQSKSCGHFSQNTFYSSYHLFRHILQCTHSRQLSVLSVPPKILYWYSFVESDDTQVYHLTPRPRLITSQNVVQAIYTATYRHCQFNREILELQCLHTATGGTHRPYRTLVYMLLLGRDVM